MTRQEFLEQLSKQLPPEEREERLALYSEMIDARTDTGRVEVPKTTTGGSCEITTDTGSIKITVAE